MEYALPHCPVDVDAMMEHGQLEPQFLKQVPGSSGGKRCHRVTLRQLCRLPTLLERKKILTAKLLERLLVMAETERSAHVLDWDWRFARSVLETSREKCLESGEVEKSVEGRFSISALFAILRFCNFSSGEKFHLWA